MLQNLLIFVTIKKVFWRNYGETYFCYGLCDVMADSLSHAYGLSGGERQFHELIQTQNTYGYR